MAKARSTRLPTSAALLSLAVRRPAKVVSCRTISAERSAASRAARRCRVDRAEDGGLGQGPANASVGAHDAVLDDGILAGPQYLGDERALAFPVFGMDRLQIGFALPWDTVACDAPYLAHRVVPGDDVPGRLPSATTRSPSSTGARRVMK